MPSATIGLLVTVTYCILQVLTASGGVIGALVALTAESTKQAGKTPTPPSPKSTLLVLYS